MCSPVLPNFTLREMAFGLFLDLLESMGRFMCGRMIEPDQKIHGSDYEC